MSFRIQRVDLLRRNTMRNGSLFIILAVLGFFSVFAQAQNSEKNPSGIEVIEYSWKPFEADRSAVAMPQFPHQDYGVIGSTPPRPEYQRTGINGEWRRQPEDPNAAPKRVQKLDEGETSFDVAMKLKNTGVKTVRSFEAVFVFTDPRGDEIVRYTFAASKSLSPNEASEFKRNVTGSKRKEYSKPLTVDIVSDIRHRTTKIAVKIIKVVYSDGTSYEAPEK